MVAVRWAGWPACYYRPTANPSRSRGVLPGVSVQRLKSTAVVFAPLTTTATVSPGAGW